MQIKPLLLSSLMLASSLSFASELIEPKIVKDLNTLIPQLSSEKIVFAKTDKHTKLDIIRLKSGSVIAMPADRSYLLQNPDIYVIGKNKEFTPLNTLVFRDLFKAAFNEFLGKGILYKAHAEKIRVQVYFDYACMHCHTMFNEREKYLAKGISLEFIPYSINPERTQMAKAITTRVVNASNPQKQLASDMQAIMEGKLDFTKLEKEKIAPKVNRLFKETQNKLAITATPSILFADGNIIVGAATADDILAASTKE